MPTTSRQAASIALAGALALTLAVTPASAGAQLPSPPDLSGTVSNPVDDLEQAVGEQLGAVAPGVVGSGNSDQSAPEQAPNQPAAAEPAAANPNPPVGADGPDTEQAAPPQTSSAPQNPPASAPSRRSATPAGDAAGRDAPTRDTSPASTDPTPPPDSEQAASRARADRDSGVLERLVSFVPTPIKVAIGVLGALFAIAALVATRTRRHLRAAERRSLTDALTELPNRRAGEEVLHRLVAAARRNGRPISVALLDLDHFKAINDTHGHAMGDDALRAAAKATRGALRASDHVARFGGEEFLIMLPETDRDNATIVAEKLRAEIAGVTVAGLPKGMTASCGVAVYPGDSADADELVATADKALYCAKDNGRDRVEVVDHTGARVAALA